MQEALERHEEEEEKTADKSEILEYLAFSIFKQGHVRHALKITKDLIRINPNHPRAVGNLAYFERLINDSSQTNLRGDVGKDVPIDNFIVSLSQASSQKPSEFELYESLCRGEGELDASILSKLVCYFMDTKNSHYLRLMRVKIEEAYKKPYILIYHDVMSDNEIQQVKKLASPRLRRATVQNSKTGETEVAEYRVSKSAWLKPSESQVVNRVTKRIQEFAKLSTESAEDLQVVNYGIGGQYEPHYDFARRGEKSQFKRGNRIATWLNYMSDVEAGGSTVFPLLGVELKPKKGTAAFWFNLHKNGEGDMLTRHAACPVLLGSKWVSNIWFHEREQEFLRPCGLNYDDY